MFLKVFGRPGSSPERPEGRSSGRLERSLTRPGAVWAREGASGEPGGASGELRESFWELWGAHLEAPETMLAALGLIF